MDLTISTEVTDQGRWLLRLTGALDLESRVQLTDVGHDAVTAEGATAVVVNLAAISFIDSTGIGAIVGLAGEAADGGIAFALQDPAPRVRRILQITGLLDAWPIEPADPIEPVGPSPTTTAS